MAADKSQNLIAKRYADALLALADESGALDTIAADLAALRRMLADSADLTALVNSPLLPRDAQSKAMLAVAAKAGLSQTTANFLGVTAANRRLPILPAIIDSYLSELARRRGEMEASVTSAQPLSKIQAAAIADALKKSMGGKVILTQMVDPSLMGGLVVKVGSKQIDSSVRSRLERLERTMKEVA